MKPTFLLLAASLIANVALVALIATRSSTPAVVTAKSSSIPSSRSTSVAGKSDALHAALAAGDAAALEAAGLSPELAREVVVGRVFSRFAERARTAQSKSNSEQHWWRNRSAAPGSREGPLVARRELADALTKAFGDDFGLSGADQGQLGFLSPEKREALRRIVQDYDEMMAKFSAGGIQLASDKEKLRLLKAERDRDIAALLTPEERLAYEMRTSPTAINLRNRYGEALESEEDFRKLYTLQKAFDDKFPLDSLSGRISSDTMRQRADAQRQLQDDIRTTLGDDKYAAVRRAMDGDLRNLDSLVARLNLPPNTTERVVAARETFSTESQRISADAALTVPQRRAQIQELAGRAKADLARTLGGEAADAYAQSSPWVSMLQNGMAYSTTPTANSTGSLVVRDGVGPGIFPVLPAGTNTAGMTRVIMGGAAGAGDGTRTTDQVMTFTTNTGEVPVTPGAGKSMIIVTPSTNPTPPPPPKP